MTTNFKWAVYGETLPQKTDVWMAYDSQNFYFAFYCHDTNPERIRGTLAKRDSIMNEDWIDVDIDFMGNRQTTYEHACNPLGIQADLVNSVSAGESIDPDWVWYSAGRMVADGYIVEIHIPLKSHKFSSGKQVTMHMAIYRNVSHSGTNASWPQQDRDRGYFNSLAAVELENLDNPLRLEVLPAVTFSSIRERETPQQWGKTDSSLQAGVDVKYGVTSTSNLELTVNPDFSQVESDQFQVLANQRYPVFFNEKRPFFMESANLFGLAGSGNGPSNMFSAVHTRTIVDPAWGARFSGDFSRISLGVLAAGDEWPGREWSDGMNPRQGKDATFLVGRGKYVLGGENFIGLLYSGREFGDEYNRVIGGDVSFRLNGKHRFSGNILFSSSRDEQRRDSSASALTAMYSFSQKPLDMIALFEDYGRDFRMDTAFYNRTGIRRFFAYVAPHFFPQWKAMPGLRRITLNLQGTYVHDKFTGKDDSSLVAELRFDLSRQSTVEIAVNRDSEFWGGQTFIQHSWYISAQSQLLKWLRVHASTGSGDKVYYDATNPFLGKKWDFHVCSDIQVSSKLKQSLSYTFQDFHRADGDERVYRLNILVSRTTFQFNKYFFLRGLVQYDSFRHKILSDLLASFTLIPGTVIHLGYGSLYDKQEWNNGAWLKASPDSRYYATRQTLFLKVGYRIRF